MGKFFKYILFVLALIVFALPISQVNAQEENKISIYFTGIGCPHCAKVSPVLHQKVQDGSLIVIEYEIYKQIANSQILNKYIDEYGLNNGIPQVLLSKDIIFSGDSPILDNLDQMILDTVANDIPLSSGNTVSIENLNINDLERYVVIYSKDRVAIRQSLTKLDEEQNTQIKNFIFSKEVADGLIGLEGKSTDTEKVEYPGGSATYEHAIKLNGWLLQWNGDDIKTSQDSEEDEDIEEESKTVSIGRVISLGLADSVNPCALSILALVLISIVTYNPGSRKKILLAGISFVLAVLIMYLIYGFLIIKAFEVVQSITSIREFLYGNLGLNLILGIGAILLGLLGIKDFVKYKPGSIGTEMPIFLRPKVTNLISKITSPLAAFGVGMFVTLFLLPCTIGPYVILGGLLANQSFMSVLPSLLLYNLIFVLPMLAVTVIVYIGSNRAEDVKDWKDRNVRYMHLVAGILMLVIGLLIVFGKF